MRSSFIAVDTGGTFTDLVVFDPQRSEFRYTKSLTTHHNPIEGILDCVAKTGTALDAGRIFKHGTTLVINTLIERSGPRIALVTTRGFRDVLELARGNRTESFNLFYRRDPPLVPREGRFEIDERVDGEGKVLLAPTREQVAALAEVIRGSGVEGVAISFINAYLEPVNEASVAAWLREMLPDCFITAGSELSREWYEYERTTTAAANAYTGPAVGRYVEALGEQLRGHGFDGQLLLMGSNGGMLSPALAGEAPVMLIESGPIGGCIGAGVYGEALGLSDIIAFDMGGTTAKCALVRDGEFEIVSTYHAGGYGKGVPIRSPVIDIVEVGAGGGSIAWLDDQSRLHVGPRSAGSKPGPVCYRRGGTEPTVTDANLVLGRLNADRFQGGEMALDLVAARLAMSERLGAPMGYVGDAGVLQVASGILALAVVAMSGAIKRITVERGKDPRDFTLFAYGGGGPLHAVELARELSIPLVVIPPEPGNFSAIGMLLADIRRDDGRTLVRQLTDAAMPAVAEVLETMSSGLRTSLKTDFGDVALRFESYGEMRFVGQFHTVRIKLTTLDAAELTNLFMQAYIDRYGHAMKAVPVEIVSLHVAAFAQTPRPELDQLFGQRTVSTETTRGTRPIYFSDARASLPTTVYARDALPVGFAADGPAVIEEYGSTTVIAPGDHFEIGRLGEIRIKVAPPARKGAA